MQSKKLYFLLLATTALFTNEYCLAQNNSATFKQITTNDTTKSSQSKDLIRTANDLKSGNSMDVLTNFFQLAAGDITSNNHSFNFKSTLFAIKAKADSNLLIDTNYIKQKFSRNFQFNFNLKFDSNYHFNGFNGGFTWSIVNKRDASVFQFFNKYTKEFDSTLDANLNAFEDSYYDTVRYVNSANIKQVNPSTGKSVIYVGNNKNGNIDSSEKYVRYTNTAAEYFKNNSKQYPKIDTAKYILYVDTARYDVYFIISKDAVTMNQDTLIHHDSISFIIISKENVDIINRNKAAVEKMENDSIFSVSLLPKEFTGFASETLDTLFKKQDALFQSNLADVAKKPLVTLSANGNFDKQNSKLNGGDAEFVWLQGFKSKAYNTGNGSSCESDFRLTGNTKDTTLNNLSITRTIAGGTWGINIMAIHNNKSIFEFKPNFEYSHVFHGTLADEKKDNFYANADLRIRITDNLWVPITIKYDVKKGNFLGFLNVSLNMNAFKNTKS